MKLFIGVRSSGRTLEEFFTLYHEVQGEKSDVQGH